MIYILGLIMSGVTLYLIIDAMIDIVRGYAESSIIMVPMIFTIFVSLVICIWGCIMNFKLGG